MLPEQEVVPGGWEALLFFGVVWLDLKVCVCVCIVRADDSSHYRASEVVAVLWVV